MANKIRLLGKSELHTDEHIKSNRDYGLFLIASRISKETTDEENELIFRLKISHIEALTDLKEHKQIKVESGLTPSQKMRFLIEQNLGPDEYESFINYLMSRIDGLCEDYKEN